MVNPLDQYHGCIIVFAGFELVTHRVDESVKIEDHILGREACKDRVFDFLVYFHCKLFDVLDRATDERDDIAENGVEKLVFEYFFSVVLDHVVDGLAGGELHLAVFVLEALANRLHELRQEGGLLLFLIEPHCYYRQAIQSTSATSCHGLVLRESLKELNPEPDLIQLAFLCELFDVLLHYLVGIRSFLHGPR